jgi:hypothetical protein
VSRTHLTEVDKMLDLLFTNTRRLRGNKAWTRHLLHEAAKRSKTAYTFDTPEYQLLVCCSLNDCISQLKRRKVTKWLAETIECEMSKSQLQGER